MRTKKDIKKVAICLVMLIFSTMSVSAQTEFAWGSNADWTQEGDGITLTKAGWLTVSVDQAEGTTTPTVNAAKLDLRACVDSPILISTSTANGPISFADSAVKALCVANWDTDGDGELSYEEAAAVTSLGTVFRQNTEITTFDELQYFTGLTSIYGQAFYGCKGLTSLTIPDSVTEIGYDAFTYCSGLTSVNIPNSVTSIGWATFYGCTGLTSVHIKDISTWCCISFTHNNNPLHYAHHLYLNDEEVKNLVVPNNVTYIGKYAFDGCRGLTSVTISNSVTEIGECAFQGCTGLTSVTIPNSVTELGEGAFQECTGLASVTIPNSVTSIGGYFMVAVL